MTIVALLPPAWNGDTWWGLIEVPWSRQKGPPHPKLVIPVPWSPPNFKAALLDGAPPEPSPPHSALTAEHIEVDFLPMRLAGEAHPRWTALLDGNHEAIHLLNVAYTCADGHPHWEPAKRLREQFERVMGGFGG